MRRARAALAVAVHCLGLLSARRAAASSAGSSGGITLARPVGARGIGMGESFTAAEGGLDSLGFNPAGVARLERPALQLQYTNGTVDDHFSSLSYAHRVKAAALWAGFSYYDAGSVNLQFASGATERVSAQQDFVGTAGAAVSFGMLSAGAAAKLYRFSLAEAATATGVAGDFGVQARTPVDGLTFGASARNVGPDVKYEEEGDPLPLEARVGAAYLLDLAKLDLVRSMEYSMSQFLFTLDGAKPRDDDPWLGFGVEMRMLFGQTGSAAVRFGYRVNRPYDAPSLGLGVRERRFTVDYALGIRREVSSVHTVTLGWLF